MNTQKSHRGFTLIEILVVLTIIGLLAAVILPVFATAREKSRQSVCVSNLHQIGLALQMYQDDHSGWLPPNFCDTSGNLYGQQQGIDALSPYERDPKIYYCPDRPGPIPPITIYLRNDYQYRVQDLLQFQDRFGQTEAIIKPDPLSVLVIDYNHATCDKAYLILRANGSVSHVSWTRATEWFYQPNGHWSQINTTSYGQELVFSDEPWPPQYEKAGP